MLDSLSEKPRLIIDAEVIAPEEFNFIAALEKDIHNRPEIFLRALGSLTVQDDNGQKIVVDSWEEKPAEKTPDKDVDSAEGLIHNYLENNYGKAVELDEDGEDMLGAQETYGMLIAAIHNQKGTRAETAKSQLARLTLRVFTERVIEWKKVSEIDPMSLPKAS